MIWKVEQIVGGFLLACSIVINANGALNQRALAWNVTPVMWMPIRSGCGTGEIRSFSSSNSRPQQAGFVAGSTAIAQSSRDAVDAEMNIAPDAFVAVTAPVAFDQFDLQVVQRVHIGKAVANRAGQYGIVFQQ